MMLIYNLYEKVKDIMDQINNYCILLDGDGVVDEKAELILKIRKHSMKSKQAENFNLLTLLKIKSTCTRTIAANEQTSFL